MKSLLKGLFKAPFIATAAFLSGCAYTAPYRTTGLAESAALADPNQVVLVTLSATEHRPGKRWEFFQDTQRVLAELPNQPGLLGYSFRFELFGNEAWTLTAWENEPALATFVRSPAHGIAVQNSRETAQNIRFMRLHLQLSDLPILWSEVRDLLASTPPRDFTVREAHVNNDSIIP